MQPHSMAALSLVNYVWGYKYYSKEIYKAKVRVSYERADGKSRLNIYDLSDIRIKDEKELKVRILRDGGGLSCVVVANRSSVRPDAEVTMTHETNHISGLRERYTIREKSISGRHENSMKYGAFSGSSDNHRLKLDFTCNIKDMRTDRYRYANYKLELIPYER